MTLIRGPWLDEIMSAAGPKPEALKGEPVVSSKAVQYAAIDDLGYHTVFIVRSKKIGGFTLKLLLCYFPCLISRLRSASEF